ncbi:HDIG domain-containing protein [Methylobacterium sp. 275MFSha3.1]|uniref:HD-GYP domain-containing protein n=1 Tax=Methylobacterium sp. 275MFSha3.1 TaxID=1502746 RepID=UPI0008A77E83|nr:HD domain-containing phosphohydrolase [Methylobacterium sp. 275MFSha3.1]SEI16181.1 HDIG domain-containing protein [Methylobacterium sp. 275MFSha3.1]
MGRLLLISDDLARTGRLARSLGPTRRCTVQDLYDDSLPSVQPDLIVGDVAQLTSEAIARLQRMLEPLRGAGAPFLFLTHGNAARAEAQARLLAPTDILPALTMLERLLARIDHLLEVGGSAVAARMADEARQFFDRTFFSGQMVTPELASTGTGLIARAVQHCGLREWIGAVQRFDEATHRHCLIVTGLAAAFAAKLGFADLDSYRLTKAALLHDVGKTRISTAILNKPGRLTDEEMTVMRTHAALGYDMLVDSGFSREMLQVVRSHHEMLDGSGYPDGLRAPEISDLVRLVTICDIYGALIERRPYRAPMPGRQAYGIVQSMTGRLDPDLVTAFRPVMTTFDPTGTAAA